MTAQTPETQSSETRLTEKHWETLVTVDASRMSQDERQTLRELASVVRSIVQGDKLLIGTAQLKQLAEAITSAIGVIQSVSSSRNARACVDNLLGAHSDISDWLSATTPAAPNIKSQVSGDMVLVPRAELETLRDDLYVEGDTFDSAVCRNSTATCNRWLASSSDTLSSKKGE